LEILGLNLAALTHVYSKLFLPVTPCLEYTRIAPNGRMTDELERMRKQDVVI
jgi:hypothetical protein